MGNFTIIRSGSFRCRVSNGVQTVDVYVDATFHWDDANKGGPGIPV